MFNITKTIIAMAYGADNKKKQKMFDKMRKQFKKKGGGNK